MAHVTRMRHTSHARHLFTCGEGPGGVEAAVDVLGDVRQHEHVQIVTKIQRGNARERLRRVLLPDLEGINRKLQRGAHGGVARGELADGSDDAYGLSCVGCGREHRHELQEGGEVTQLIPLLIGLILILLNQD